MRVTTTAQIFNKDTGVFDVTFTYDDSLSYVLHHEKKTWQSAIAGWKLRGILLFKDLPPEETPDLEHIAWEDPRFITALKPYLETQFGDLLEIRLSDQSSTGSLPNSRTTSKPTQPSNPPPFKPGNL